MNISQEIAKLETKYQEQRKVVVENYRNNLIESNFYNTFYFSFPVLLILFLLIRIFAGNKTQTIEVQPSPVISKPQIEDFTDVNIAVIQEEDSQNLDSKKTAILQKKEASNLPQSVDSDKNNVPGKSLQNLEKPDAEETFSAGKCIVHLSTLSKFICQGCESQFCGKCVKTFEQQEDCCPLCRIPCRVVSSETVEETKPPTTEEKKKPSLDAEETASPSFTIYDYPDEKPRKLGIIPAFVIALLFSASISISWVYKIAPYLEGRQEISQNASSDEAQKTENSNSAQGAGQATDKSVSSANSPNASQNTAGNSNAPCIDPETRQPFECDDETRKVLYEHTRKVESVEKAKKETAEKTNLVMSLVSSEAREEVAKSSKENPKLSAAEEERKERDKQQLIKVFGGSFVIIFGLLMLSRLFSKG